MRKAEEPRNQHRRGNRRLTEDEINYLKTALRENSSLRLKNMNDVLHAGFPNDEDETSISEATWSRIESTGQRRSLRVITLQLM